MAGVTDGSVTEASLAAKLREHVDRADAQAALEYVTSRGLANAHKAEVFIRPMDAAATTSTADFGGDDGGDGDDDDDDGRTVTVSGTLGGGDAGAKFSFTFLPGTFVRA